MDNVLFNLGRIEGFLLSVGNTPEIIHEDIKALKDHITTINRPYILKGNVDMDAVEKRVASEVSEIKSDDEKIKEFLEKPITVKVRKPSSISPENREKAAQRMRDYQARKKAEREAASSGIVGEEISAQDPVVGVGDQAHPVVNPDGSITMF